MTQLTPQQEAASLRTSTVLATDGYLNNPIVFNEDSRLIPETLLQSAGVENLVTRNPAGFFVVIASSTNPMYYAVGMRSPLYDRNKVKKYIDQSLRTLNA